MPNITIEKAQKKNYLSQGEKDSPLVSVVIPTYNRLSLLNEAIASVKSQTYSNWELIIVDDGSKDDTVEAIHQLNDPRIRVISVSHIGLLGILRNIGANNSNGRWLAFLDSDDLWIPEKLEKQLQILKTEKRRWAYCGSELVDENKMSIAKKAGTEQFYSGWIVKKILTTKTDFTISSLLVEKKLFEEAGKFSDNPKLFCREDHELTLRLALKAESSVVPDILVRIREHTGRTTYQLAEAFERSAAVYSTFLGYATDKTLRKIARKRKAFHFAEASICRFSQGNYKLAIKQLNWSFWNGDNKRHSLSAVKRCIYALIKKHFHPSAKGRKTKDVAAYNT